MKTSALLFAKSLPSTFPTKFKLESLNNLYAAFSTSLPFVGSSPLFSRPTLGLSISKRISASFEPMSPYWNKIFGLTSRLAPESRNITLPSFVGNTDAMDGLIMPFCLPKIDIALTSVAPVEPAENTA